MVTFLRQKEGGGYSLGNRPNSRCKHCEIDLWKEGTHLTLWISWHTLSQDLKHKNTVRAATFPKVSDSHLSGACRHITCDDISVQVCAWLHLNALWSCHCERSGELTFKGKQTVTKATVAKKSFPYHSWSSPTWKLWTSVFILPFVENLLAHNFLYSVQKEVHIPHLLQQDM